MGELKAAVQTPRRHWSVVVLKNRMVGVLLFEALIVIIFSIAARKFLTLSNLNTIFLNACILAILACAEAVVIITRNYDVSVASMLALAAFVGFDLIKKFPNAGPVLILVPIGIGVVCGLINGVIVAYGRVSSVFVTLAGLSIYRGVVTIYAKGHQIEPKDISDWVRGSVTGHLLPGISNLAINTRIGRQIYAIGSNPDAATFYGLKVPRVILGAYLLCGAMVGLSGFLFAARSSYVVPWFAQGLEMQVIGAVVVGGVSVLGGSGNVVGAALGAIVLTTMDNGLILIGTHEVIRQLLYGVAIVGACILDASVLKQVSRLLKSSKRLGARR
jgi:rhamnose transport system permease protein